MRQRSMLLVLALGLSLAAFAAPAALAHRPYFEEEDIGAEDPWQIDDPSISTALYATLESADDVDYYAFDGVRGEVILLALTIPQIEGQDQFAPTMALLGPGLPADDLPDSISLSSGVGVLVIEPPPGRAPTFFEPFSQTSYWERQEQHVTLPADGSYRVAIWHPDGTLGRYTFVIGEKEKLGGDLAFPVKMRSYWTPVENTDSGSNAEPAVKSSCGPRVDR